MASFSICGDYKVTVKPGLDVDQYPPPKLADLFASLAGGRPEVFGVGFIPSLSATPAR